MRAALFWVVTQRVIAFPWRRFGTTYSVPSSRIQQSKNSWPLKMGLDPSGPKTPVRFFIYICLTAVAAVVISVNFNQDRVKVALSTLLIAHYWQLIFYIHLTLYMWDGCINIIYSFVLTSPWGWRITVETCKRIMFFVPCIMIQLCNANQQIANFLN